MVVLRTEHLYVYLNVGLWCSTMTSVYITVINDALLSEVFVYNNCFMWKYEMDEFVKNKLKSWNLEKFIPLFEGKCLYLYFILIHRKIDRCVFITSLLVCLKAWLERWLSARWKQFIYSSINYASICNWTLKNTNNLFILFKTNLILLKTFSVSSKVDSFFCTVLLGEHIFVWNIMLWSICFLLIREIIYLLIILSCNIYQAKLKKMSTLFTKFTIAENEVDGTPFHCLTAALKAELFEKKQNPEPFLQKIGRNRNVICR